MRIVLVSGGTGGHIFPAVGLAQELKRRGHSDIIFISDDNVRTADIIKRGGFYFEPLDVPRMPYGLSIKWPSFILRLILSRFKADELVAKLNPDIIVGFGAYISGPVVSVAKQKGIKTLIHEQNAFLGRANRLLINKADRVCFSFSNKLTGVSDKYILTGNPLRDQLMEDFTKITKKEALAMLKLSLNRKTILVLGGSTGASAINNILIEIATGLNDSEKKQMQIIHITGDRDLDAVSQSYRANDIACWVKGFYDRMAILYKAADLIICRAGATTIAEICLFGLPAIFIPYPWAGSHQRDNTDIFVRSGGAIVLEQDKTSAEILKEKIFEFINDEDMLRKMGSAMRSFARPDAARQLADSIEELIRC